MLKKISLSILSLLLVAACNNSDPNRKALRGASRGELKSSSDSLFKGSPDSIILKTKSHTNK